MGTNKSPTVFFRQTTQSYTYMEVIYNLLPVAMIIGNHIAVARSGVSSEEGKDV